MLKLFLVLDEIESILVKQHNYNTVKIENILAELMGKSK